ncbi:hypothetical protein J5N97_015306 [Dioscorea zingiberensis]|uniref:Uncharacterized protein n=1 Tax=Dioscorea zingiberensis TaxID=325984 RepID=A0A9D5HL15_9LILI|nr:hypothetical protein J5N97_015306 [Dioscorea zingiberensis]
MATSTRRSHNLVLMLFITISITVTFFSPTSKAMPSQTKGSINLGWLPTKPNYKGAIEDFLEGEELELGSEISRRILATSDYISYDALRRDSTPCSRRGASYYNCRAGSEANPYSRGCSAITRCRS